MAKITEEFLKEEKQKQIQQIEIEKEEALKSISQEDYRYYLLEAEYDSKIEDINKIFSFDYFFPSGNYSLSELKSIPSFYLIEFPNGKYFYGATSNTKVSVEKLYRQIFKNSQKLQWQFELEQLYKERAKIQNLSIFQTFEQETLISIIYTNFTYQAERIWSSYLSSIKDTSQFYNFSPQIYTSKQKTPQSLPTIKPNQSVQLTKQINQLNDSGRIVLTIKNQTYTFTSKQPKVKLRRLLNQLTNPKAQYFDNSTIKSIRELYGRALHLDEIYFTITEEET